MATPRPTTRTGELLLPSKPKAALSRRNSLESARQQLHSSCARCRAEHALRQKVATLKLDLWKAELECENLRLENSKLLQQLQTGNSHRKTIQERVSELTEENNSLKRELQCSEGFRGDLGLQLLSVRKDEDSICQEKKAALQENQRLRKQNESLCQERESILREKDRITQQNVSLRNSLNSLEPEAATLGKENERLKHESALLRQEFSERLKTLTEERVALQKENERLKRDDDQDKLYLQKIKAVEQNAEGLAQEVVRLQQTLDG